MRKVNPLYYEFEPVIIIESIQRKGSLVTYQIVLGAFEVDLKVLHVRHKRPESNNEVLGKGSFGSVQRMSLRKKNVVTKMFAVGSDRELLNLEDDKLSQK